MSEHIKKDSEGRNFKICNECGKQFSTRHYRRHLRTHENAKKKKELLNIEMQTVKEQFQHSLEQEPLPFTQLFSKICNQYRLEELYHIKIREDAITPAALNLFKQRWIVIEGVYRICKNPSTGKILYTHYLVKKNTDFNIKTLGRRLRIGAKTQRACTVFSIAVKKNGTVLENDSIKNLMDVLINIIN